MEMTGPQLRVIVAGHARAEAAATARAMGALRTAVWADAKDFAASLETLAGNDADGDARDWLMGLDADGDGAS